MTLIGVILDPLVAAKILDHLKLPSRAPPRGRPRRLGQQELAFDDVPDLPDYDAVNPIFAEA
jgi:hypothetical protein